MKWFIVNLIFISTYYIIRIKGQVIRRWNPEELIRKSIDDNPQSSFFISDPNKYLGSSDLLLLTEDLKQIYIHFHFTVFVFIFPQMTLEYSSLDGEEGINKFSNDTLKCFLQQTDFGEESTIFIVYPIENEVIKIIGGEDVLNIYSDADLLNILERQLDNFRDANLIHSFHSIFEEIAHDTPHSFMMKIKYLIWKYQSLAIGLVAGLLFIIDLLDKRPQNEVFIDKMQMFVLQLKFQAKWKSHCLICLEKLPKKDKNNKGDDDNDEGVKENEEDEEDTENNSKKKLKPDELNETDEDEEDEEDEYNEEEEEDEDEEEEVEEAKINNKKQKNNKSKKNEWEECDTKEEDNDKCEYVDQLRLALCNFENKSQNQNITKKDEKKELSQPGDIPPALSIKIRKALRQRKIKAKTKKIKKEEKPKNQSKQQSKASSKNNSLHNSITKNHQKESSLFLKKSLKTTKEVENPIQEELKPTNIFKSKYTMEEKERLEKKGKEKITLDCGHSFHRSCFDEWHEIKHTSSCPICDYHVFSNTNQIGDDTFKNRLVKLQQVFHPELKDIDVNL